ncbi:2-dehydropantoate 2-reductase [Cucurbitaria berberidis CBS 394.84]|uniref:2-dehydropantoate 2-reductase n=1 Tax=Cucurbitaria berberidis CBS 394.84 TaxID=1168544 RepID=A0A9P4LB15_9PLEO|nr:2-dehydropantoate 2-reductase [Cucurbitaria berberidis CBS 394.84]KAF1848585.1 2-dehydropantoate 2-reductase [Cucurbitaria berberidis CBS 394.84]
MANPKKSILIIGGGAVGAIAALNLEAGGLATVTIVLRSNYNVVKEHGYHIESCDHGVLEAWRPSVVRKTVPNITEEELQPYDYVILATKNIPDISPNALDLVTPALPKNSNRTTLLLYQNGLNIEKPFVTSHPNIPVLSGISMIGSDEPSPGHIIHGEGEKLKVGAFKTSNINPAVGERRAQEFVELYGKSGKTDVTYSPDVLYDRWKKLVYNASLNPICAITGLDSGRIRLADGGVEGLVKPAMKEIVAAAKACAGVELDEGIVEWTINADPLESYLKPSMQQDLEKGNFIEFENLVGEPLREGKNAGVPMPTLEVLYQLARAIQWRVRDERGLVDIPKKSADGSETTIG